MRLLHAWYGSKTLWMVVSGCSQAAWMARWQSGTSARAEQSTWGTLMGALSGPLPQSLQGRCRMVRNFSPARPSGKLWRSSATDGKIRTRATDGKIRLDLQYCMQRFGLKQSFN